MSNPQVQLLTEVRTRFLPYKVGISNLRRPGSELVEICVALATDDADSALLPVCIADPRDGYGALTKGLAEFTTAVNLWLKDELEERATDDS